MQPTDRDQQTATSSAPPLPPPIETRTAAESAGAVADGLRALSQSSVPPDDPWRLEVERQDRRAVRYDEIHELSLPVFRAYEDWMTEAIYSAWYEVRGRVLLVGCGTGAQLQRLALRMPAKMLTAIDVAPEMTRRAREKVPSNVEVRTIPFDRFMPSVPFDTIVFTGSLAAMPDLRAVCEHTAQMTVLGSRVVVCAANGDWEFADEAKRRSARMLYPGWYWHRLVNSSHLARVNSLAAAIPPSPHPALSPARIATGFEARFGLRDLKTEFGVTRLFEDALAIDPRSALKTVGPTREARPYMRTIERLKKHDAAFGKQNRDRGGVLAMLLDRLR